MKRGRKHLWKRAKSTNQKGMIYGLKVSQTAESIAIAPQKEGSDVAKAGTGLLPSFMDQLQTAIGDISQEHEKGAPEKSESLQTPATGASDSDEKKANEKREKSDVSRTERDEQENGDAQKTAGDESAVTALANQNGKATEESAKHDHKKKHLEKLSEGAAKQEKPFFLEKKQDPKLDLSPLAKGAASVHRDQSKKKGLPFTEETTLNSKLGGTGKNKEAREKGEAITEGMVRVFVDPEKWEIGGKSEKRPSLNIENSLTGRHLSAKEKGGAKEKGEGFSEQNRQESRSFTSNLFSRLDSLSTPERTETVKHDSKELWNELVQKAKVNLGSDGKSTATIRLNPESLGRLTMNLHVNQNSVEARLVVETESAKKMIQREIEGLKTELKSHGITVETFTVKVRDAGFSPFEQSAGDQNSQFHSEFGTEQNFSKKGDEERNFEPILTHQISETFDDYEYETLTHRPRHDGAVNLTV